VRPNVLENGEKSSANEFLIAVKNDREQLTCRHSVSDRSTPTDFHPIDEKAVLLSIRKRKNINLEEEKNVSHPKSINNENIRWHPTTLLMPIHPETESRKECDMQSHTRGQQPSTMSCPWGLTNRSPRVMDNPEVEVAPTAHFPPKSSEPSCAQYVEVSVHSSDSGTSPVRDFHSSQFSLSRNSWQNRTEECTLQQ